MTARLVLHYIARDLMLLSATWFALGLVAVLAGAS